MTAFTQRRYTQPVGFGLLSVILIAFMFLPLAAVAVEDTGLESHGIEEKHDLELKEWRILEQKAAEAELDKKEEKRRRWLGARLMSRIITAGFASFSLEGEVVDQDGNLLDDVALQVVKTKDLGPERSKSDIEERIVNRTFLVKARGYSSLYLYFNKDGYYEKRMYVSCDDEDDPFSPDYQPDRSVERRDIRIVLEKMGNIVRLVKQDFELTYRRQDGVSSGGVIGFDWHRWELRGRGAGSLWPKPVNDLRDPDQLPPRCLYIQAAVNRDGSIASINKSLPHWQRPVVFPQKLRLVLNDPEGGVIMYEQKEGERAFWSMKEAPEEGYKQGLVIDADWLFRRSPVISPIPAEGIYFYFKVDGRYGKGKLETPEIVEDNRELEVKVHLQMQLDGSRNLDTGRN